MLVFWDKRQININNWLWEEQKKLHNLKFLLCLLNTDEQKEIYNQIKSLTEENRYLRDKYIKWLNKIKIENMIQWLIEPILEQKVKYFNDYYNAVIEEKRKEYMQKMKKKLKVEREILCPF